MERTWEGPVGDGDTAAQNQCNTDAPLLGGDGSGNADLTGKKIRIGAARYLVGERLAGSGPPRYRMVNRQSQLALHVIGPAGSAPAGRPDAPGVINLGDPLSLRVEPAAEAWEAPGRSMGW